MKTIKELTAFEKDNEAYFDGYMDCKKDVKKLIDEEIWWDNEELKQKITGK